MSRPTLAILALVSPVCLGAPITWEAAFDITGTGDLRTNGTLVEARNATNDGNSPSVSAGGESITFQAFNPGVSVTATGSFFTGGGGDTGNADLNAVLNSHAWSANDWSFQLTGLSAGAEYQLQLVAGGDTRGCCSGRNQRAGDGEAPESISGDYSRSGVGSAVGTFTAGGGTQTVRILKGLLNGVDPSLSGYILRETTPIAPTGPTGLGLSNADLAPNTPAGTTIGTFVTTDPNANDTHTYAMGNAVSFPNNSLFMIVGNELRAAAQLGGFGASYQIRVQTTDNTGRSFSESFRLAVEPAEAPVAVTLSASTVLQGTPVGGTVGTIATVDPNAADAHTYALATGEGDDENGSFSIVKNELRTTAAMPPVGSLLSVRVRSTDLSGLAVEGILEITVVNTTVRINEFLADNTTTSLADEDGDTPDWVELHNPESGSVSLAGWFLTDDPGDLTKWPFPAVSIGRNGFLVVFASGKDRAPVNGDPLHTNFALAQSGEYLALVAADGSTVISEFGSASGNYPNQRAGISYGPFGTPPQVGYMFTPTPGAPNDASSAVIGFVDDTRFDVDRGFFAAPFDVTITTNTPGATIRYTIDGSWPSETVGTVYNGPVRIERTLPLKAIAYRAGFASSNVDTQTYLFVDDVVAQTSANTQSIWGFPATWEGVTPSYGMDQNPGIDPLTHPTIRNDLQAIPTLSIAMDADDLFGASGIYSHPQSSGQSWERLTSLEFIDPGRTDGSNDFQANCALRIQGGAFRSFGLTRKKSFRVLFKSHYSTSNLPTGGPGKLTHPLFGPDAATEFQTLTLRMEANDGWQWGAAGGQPQYARDEFGRRAQLALGQPAAHGRHCHLYLNGVYWGVYNLAERPDSGFAESYFGASRELWQGQNSGNPINDAADISDWNTMKSVVDDIGAAGSDPARDAEYLEACGFNSNGTRNNALPIWIDPTNYADYLLVNWYGGNSDWPHKNYYCGRAREPGSTGFKFFMWDSEWSLFLRSAINTNKMGNFNGVAAPQEHLEQSAEYRLRFGDRAHAALFNRGVFVPARARALYNGIVLQHPRLLNPEAARWGNQHGGARTVTGDWLGEYNRIVDPAGGWFAQRRTILLNQLRARGLYPALEAPTFAPHGGSVAAGSGPEIRVPDGVRRVYYLFGPGDADATDYRHSLDPRLVGGGVNPNARVIDFGPPDGSPNATARLPVPQPGFLLARSHDPVTGTWSALNSALFTLDTVPARAHNIVISEVHYHPAAPSLAEVQAGFVDQDLFEFLEVENISSERVDLSNVDFISGIEFVFPPGFTLPPGGRAVIVKDLAAFNFRYPNVPPARIAGVFLNESGLRNSGETLTMRAANGSIIKSFAYDDEAPWPTDPDGVTGVSLVLMFAASNPNPALARNWRPSGASGGNPGESDVLFFAQAGPGSDGDEDGVTAIVEHALGTNDDDPGDNNTVMVGTQPLEVDGQAGRYVTVTFTRELRAEDVEIVPQITTNLADWNPGLVELVFVSERQFQGTRNLVTYRTSTLFGTHDRLFTRLMVRSR